MVFVFDKIKYDTDKMELISEKCKYSYNFTSIFRDTLSCSARDVKLWRSVNDRWLLTYTKGYSDAYAVKLSKESAMNMLLDYDIDKYEELFGELEEA